MLTTANNYAIMRYMRKSILAVVSILALLISVTAVKQINAQERTGVPKYQCVNDFKRCSGPTGNENELCEPKDDDENRSKDWWHRAQINLSTLTFPPNQDLYLTECLSVGEDIDGDGIVSPICTTGDETLDKILMCGDPNDPRESCNHLKILQDKHAYSLSVNKGGIFHFDGEEFVRPGSLVIRSGGDGKALVSKIEWESHIREIEHRYHIWYIDETPVVTPTIAPTIAAATTPGVGGQQQAILTFPSGSVETITPENCNGESWDPYGFVFDTKTLEPIPNMDVLLSMKKPDGTFNAEYASSENLLIDNPFGTGDNGAYTFFVKDGDYKLMPVTQGQRFSHPALSFQSQLHSNTSLIYSDIYYNDSPAVLQRGSIQHRDIPLVPDGAGNKYDIKVISEDIALSPDGRITYTGKVSHPFTELVIETCTNENGTKTCKPQKVYTRTTGGPNKFGNYSITLDQKLLQPGEFYDRTFNKVDLTVVPLTRNFDIKKIITWLTTWLQPGAVFAQEGTNKASIHPIMTYVEGYAYDTNGNLLPNATVNIVIPLTERPVYKTVTNNKGYFKITSEFLPKISYAILYTPAGSTVVSSGKITTSQFMSQNKDFITAEKINPYLVTTKATDPRRTITPTYVPPAKIGAVGSEFKEPVSSVTSAPVTAVEQQPASNNMLLIGAILLLLVATVGTLLGVYLYKKKMQDQQL